MDINLIIVLKKDIRKVGSGNIGTTNVLRTGNKFLAFITLLLDLLKGFVSVFITLLYFESLTSYSALLCFIGHIYPVWLKFKGGKGVATYLGVILALSYKFFLVFGACWVTLTLLFRFASLSSMTSSLLVLLYAIFFENYNYSLVLFVFFVIILYTHKENIVRLKNSRENKIKL